MKTMEMKNLLIITKRNPLKCRKLANRMNLTIISKEWDLILAMEMWILMK